MINANIPLLGQSPDMIEAVNNGFADGGNFAKLLIGSQANRMRDLDGYEKQKAFADNNFFGRQLRGQLKQDQATALQTQIAQEKAFAEIGKTQSEAFKNNQQGTGFQVDANQKKLGGIQGAFIGAAQTGDRNQILLGLSALNRSGLMTPEDLTAYTEMIKVATPEDIKKMAQGFALQNAKDPASHLFTTADNVLDNKTTMRGQDIDKTIADNRLGFDYQKEEADNQLKYDSLGQDDNQFWASFNQKDAQFYSDQDFQLMKTKIEKQQVKNETPEQKIERVNNAIGSADAARQAARAAQDAAALINHPGIVLGSGATSAWGLMPGTDAKEFRARLENLKSQVFLPTVKALQGMGALSNAEGEKIASAVANLDPSLGQEALARQLAILAQQMSSSAKKARQQTQNYATRAGTIQLQTKNHDNGQSGKIYTQAMIQQYAQQSGRTTQEVAQAVRDSGGTIR